MEQVNINVTKVEQEVTINATPNVTQIIVTTQSGGGSGIPDAPNNSNAYVRSALNWVIGYTKTAIDNLLNGKVDKVTGSRLITSAESTILSNTSGTNSGDQDLSSLLVKANNLSDLANTTTARTNLGLGSLATQSGTFTDKADTDSTFPMRFQFSASSPLDNTTYYVGGSNNLILSTTNNRFVYAGITASTFRLSIFLYNNGTLGTSENVTIKLLNVTQGTNITLTTTAKFNSTSFGFVGNFTFAVTEGDALALEINCPAFAINPTNVIGGANLILNK